MKVAIFAAALALGTTAAAAQTSNYAPVPPGDGITRMGTNPEGQACTPEGWNRGLSVYPACSAMGGPMVGMEDYPPCTRQVKDRCVQIYTRWTNRR